MALRGAVSGVGVALWLPILDAMTDDNGEAFAQGGALPTSFGVFFWGNGVQFADWTPSATGQGNAWALSRNLQAFAPVKNKMTLVSGLDMLDGGFRGHGAGAPYVLCGGNHSKANVIADIDFEPYKFEQDTSTHTTPTIDQVVADHYEKLEKLEKLTPSPFKSLETGTLPYIGMGMGSISSALAHRGPNDFRVPERNPTKLYNDLFRAPVDVPGALPSDVVLAMRRSSLDAVKEDLARMKLSVGSVDAKRLDSHAEGILEIERRLMAINNVGECGPTMLPGTFVIEDKTKVTERNQATNRLVVAALACNRTRVYSHLWSGARDDNTYPMIGINDDHHQLTHSGAAGNKTASDIERYIMEQYADLAIVMSQTPLGAGTVLDSTINFGVSDMANPAGHLHTDYHLLVLGGGGGKLKGDQHLRFPKRKVTELQLTLLQTLGLPLTEWGTWDHTSATMPEILV